MMLLARLTIRSRITGGSLLIAILISIVAGIIIYNQVLHIVTDGETAVQRNIEAQYITALTQESTETIDPPGAGQLVAIVDGSGMTRIDTLPSALASKLKTLLQQPGETRTMSAAGISYLVRVTEVPTRTGNWKIVTASDNDRQVALLNEVAVLLIASIAGINIAFGASSWLIGSAVLAPVTRLRRSAADLVTRRGSELLPVGPARDEISGLARTLNELIVQLRAFADRERQVVSDASHELRTPLAIMQTQLELAQAEASSVAQMQNDVGHAQHTLARLISLANSMLELSRIDSQAAPGRASLGSISSEFADAVDRGRQRVGARDIQVEYSSAVDPTDPRIVQVTAADFGRVCDNLISNSLAPMATVGVIRLLLSVVDGHVWLKVSDDAGGMDEAFLPSAFDRFSRADTARAGTGAGLGLAIVSGIASVAGGDVDLQNHPGEGLTVVVRFPIVPDSATGR